MARKCLARVTSTGGLRLLASGCATIGEGTDQSVAVMPQPAGASSTLSRDADMIATIYPTPGVAALDKAKGNIMVECELDGYEPKLMVLPARSDRSTCGNALFGLDGLIFAGFNAISGAMHKYPSSVMVRMKSDRSVAWRNHLVVRMTATSYRRRLSTP